MSKLDNFEMQKRILLVTILKKQIGTVEFNNAYAKYKELYLGHIASNWDRYKKQYGSENEFYNYKLITELFDDNLLAEMGMTAGRLAGIMRIDEELHSYCKKQTGKGKSFGSLEYSKMLEHTAMIEDALKQV